MADGRLTTFFNRLIALNEKTIKDIIIYYKPGWYGDKFIYPNPPSEAEYKVDRAGIEYAEMFAAKGAIDEWIRQFKEASVKVVNRRSGIGSTFAETAWIAEFLVAHQRQKKSC